MNWPFIYSPIYPNHNLYHAVMGNHASTTNITNVENSGDGAHSGGVTNTTTPKQTDTTTTSVPVSVSPPAMLLAKAPTALPPANTAKAVNAVGGSSFLKADAKTQAAVAPFTSTLDKIGNAAGATTSGTKSAAGKKGQAAAKSAPDPSKVLGSLAVAYDEAHKAKTDKGAKTKGAKKGSKNDDSGDWYNAFDDVHSIVKEKATSGDADSVAVHKHLLDIMDSVKSEQDKSGATKFSSTIKSQMHWVASKQPGKDLTDALDEISDSEDEEDQNDKQTQGKARDRKGKLAGLRNIAAHAKGSKKGADGQNGVQDEEDEPKGKKGKSLPVGQVKKGKKEPEKDEDENDGEEQDG